MVLNKNNIAIVLGTRPNFIKAASFLKEAQKYPEFNFTIIHTGQHFDYNMSEIFFEQMHIQRPHINLNIKSEFHTEKIGKMLSSLDKVFKNNCFDVLVVFGDVNSTLAGAIIGLKNRCKIIHVEAGLRSHDRRMPEEINRTVIDHISDLLFTTEPSANQNLIKEGIDESKIKYVGNLMIESMELFLNEINNSKIIDKLKINKKEYVVATIHREENIDNKFLLNKILVILNEINTTIKVIFPIHPGTKNKIKSYGFDYLLDNLTVIEPLGYLDFMKLIINSKGVITDSGGIQEETSHLGIPCCTLRDNTERLITVELGSNKIFHLAEVQTNAILNHLNNNFPSKIIPLWDKEVSSRIFNILKEKINL